MHRIPVAQISAALEKAEEAWWAEMVKAFPEVKTGDFPPECHFDFVAAQKKALQSWLMWNHPALQEEQTDGN